MLFTEGSWWNSYERFARLPLFERKCRASSSYDSAYRLLTSNLDLEEIFGVAIKALLLLML